MSNIVSMDSLRKQKERVETRNGESAVYWQFKDREGKLKMSCILCDSAGMYGTVWYKQGAAL